MEPLSPWAGCVVGGPGEAGQGLSATRTLTVESTRDLNGTCQRILSSQALPCSPGTAFEVTFGCDNHSLFLQRVCCLMSCMYHCFIFGYHSKPASQPSHASILWEPSLERWVKFGTHCECQFLYFDCATQRLH